MLPILRLIPVGGVALAIVILVLALNAPSGGSYPPLPRTLMPARGALIASADHPEWPQLLIKAALRRADELNQLRQLADDGPGREPRADDKKLEKAPEVAGVPDNQSDAEPAEATGTIVQSQGAVIPVDIGEASSTELPVSQEKDRPPVIKSPQRSNPTRQSVNVAPPEPKAATYSTQLTPEPDKPARKTVRRSRRAKITAPAPDPAQFNLFAAFFAGFNIEQPAVNRQR